MIAPLLATLALWAAPDRGPVLAVVPEATAHPDIQRVIERWLEDGEGLELVMLAEDGDPAELGPARARFPDRRGIRARDRAAVETRELAAAIREADVLVLSGGRFVDWYETLFPSDGPARIAHAIYEAHSTGVPIVAFGAAGTFISGAGMVLTSEFDEPRRDPHEAPPHQAWMGLSIGAPAIVDAAGWVIGDPVELLLAQHETKVDMGFFLVGDVALLHDPLAKRARLLGDGHAIYFDLDGARRQPRALWEARVSILQPGDEVDSDSGRVLPAEVEPDAAFLPSPGPAGPLESELVTRLRTSGLAGARPTVFEAGKLRLELRTDERTRRVPRKAGPETVVDLRFDASWD